MLDHGSSHDHSLVGRIIAGDLRVIARTGSAPDGPLYRAEHLDGRPALLLVLPSLTGGGQPSRARYYRLATKIQHPNVAAVYSVGDLEDGSAYVVLEQLDGEPLRQLLASGQTLPLGEALDLAIQVASGLEAAHRADFVHGNLSPSAILLVREPFGKSQVKLIGFNPDPYRRLAIKPEAAAVEYASPERLTGNPPADERCDVFSLGAVLHHLLTGEPPGRAGSAGEVPELARRVLEKALEPRPGARFRTITDFRDALEHLVARATGPRPSGRRRAVLTGIVVGILALVAGGLWLLPAWRRTDTSGSRTVSLSATMKPAAPAADSLASTSGAKREQPRASAPARVRSGGDRAGAASDRSGEPGRAARPRVGNGDSRPAPAGTARTGEGSERDETPQALGYVGQAPRSRQPAPTGGNAASRRAATAGPGAPVARVATGRAREVLEQNTGLRHAIGDVTRIGLAEDVTEVRLGVLVVSLAPGGMDVPSALYNLQRLYLAYSAVSRDRDTVALELRQDGAVYGWFTRQGLRYASTDTDRR